MTDLTPIPAGLRRRYLDALLAGRAEAQRLGYGAMDDRVFAAFHQALLHPEDEQFEEWRVTGAPEFESRPYDFVWSPERGKPNPEQAARAFTSMGVARAWAEGPHMHRRTVTRTNWERVER